MYVHGVLRAHKEYVSMLRIIISAVILSGVSLHSNSEVSAGDGPGSDLTLNALLGAGYPEGLSLELGGIVGNAVDGGTEGLAISALAGTRGHILSVGYGLQMRRNFTPMTTMIASLSYLYVDRDDQYIGPRAMCTFMGGGASLGLFFPTSVRSGSAVLPHISFKLGF